MNFKSRFESVAISCPPEKLLRCLLVVKLYTTFNKCSRLFSVPPYLAVWANHWSCTDQVRAKKITFMNKNAFSYKQKCYQLISLSDVEVRAYRRHRVHSHIKMTRIHIIFWFSFLPLPSPSPPPSLAPPKRNDPEESLLCFFFAQPERDGLLWSMRERITLYHHHSVVSPSIPLMAHRGQLHAYQSRPRTLAGTHEKESDPEEDGKRRVKPERCLSRTL